jgi:hypothetical protein
MKNLTVQKDLICMTKAEFERLQKHLLDVEAQRDEALKWRGVAISLEMAGADLGIAKLSIENLQTKLEQACILLKECCSPQLFLSSDVLYERIVGYLDQTK